MLTEMLVFCFILKNIKFNNNYNIYKKLNLMLMKIIIGYEKE